MNFSIDPDSGTAAVASASRNTLKLLSSNYVNAD